MKRRRPDLAGARPMLDPRHWCRQTPVRSLIRPFMLTVVGLALVLTLLPLAEVPAFAQTSSWISLFTGRPSSPQQYNPSTWDILVHSRDRENWTQLEPMAAQHGADCSAPPATHQIS